MIYLDSAATTFQKPPAVGRAMTEALASMSSPGRGGHPLAMRAADTAFRCRTELAELFGLDGPEGVAFTLNATHALNIAIKSLVPPGGRVVISGYEHNAVTRPLTALKAKVSVAGGPLFDQEAAIRAFDELIAPGVDVVICNHVSNVFGFVQPVEKVAALCRSRGVPLIVDEAHGAHFRFSEYFPVSAVQLGADVVINSVHKTLPCLTQTGVIHLCSDRVSREKLKRFLGIYQSSSPSYILMSSIDACMDKLEREGDEMFRVFTENLEKARRRLSGCKYIRLVTPQACECQRVFDFDRSKILLSTVNSSLNGRELHQILRREFHLEMEMEAENYVLALAAVGDTAEGFERLCDAIEEIDRRESLKYREEAVAKEPLKNGKMKQIMRISQAMDAESERCPLDECIGRTSVEFAYLYPPGIPLIVPGEQISGHFVKNVRRYLEQGFEVQGLSDQTSETVCVVKNET